MAQWQGLGRYPENADPKDCPAAGELLAYVDGSYQDALKKYGFGCIFILPDGRIYTEYGNGDNPDSLKQRNVSGEMLGAMYAVRFALNSGFRAIEIRYDYEGIEKWVTGAWKGKFASNCLMSASASPASHTPTEDLKFRPIAQPSSSFVPYSYTGTS